MRSLHSSRWHVIGADAGTARAQDASAWVKDAHSSLRLLAGSRTGSVLMGGIEIQLQPGWKTYWRTPGDSGVPPRFDFSKSVNVESVTPLYPAPKKFDDGAGGVSYGYHKHVIFPLRIVPKNPNEPVQLRAAISYAVCEKLCLPVEAEAELAFTSAASALDSLVAGALNKVPKPVGTAEATPIALKSFKRIGDRVVVDIAAQNSAGLELLRRRPDAGLGSAGAKAGRRRREGHRPLRIPARRPAGEGTAGRRAVETDRCWRGRRLRIQRQAELTGFRGRMK